MTLAAGLASDPDEDGDCTRYVIDLGSPDAETGIYRWHHSAPSLALLIMVTWWALSSTARPPLGPDPDDDTAIRRDPHDARR